MSGLADTLSSSVEVVECQPLMCVDLHRYIFSLYRFLFGHLWLEGGKGGGRAFYYSILSLIVVVSVV